MSKRRESWTSSIGIILAVSGSSVGLGNFIRFPAQLVQNGGGTFLIPYFISLILIGLPVSWLEWNIGRYGGAYGHGSAPGALNAMFRKPWIKYFSSLSLISVFFILFYYIYLESIILAYTWYSITGTLSKIAQSGQSDAFLQQYLSFDLKIFNFIPVALIFLSTTIFFNIGIVMLGVSSGIENCAKICMPLLIILGIVMLIKILSLPNMESGLAFMWNPDFSALLKPRTWLAAAGQVFFTLSIGTGIIINYASYIKRDKDITLAALTANATNEFAEIILGGMIVIPAAAAILGMSALTEIANTHAYRLVFVVMPSIFSDFRQPEIFSAIWFLLLFFAGITSTIALYQPLFSFFTDELRYKKSNTLWILTIITFVMGSYAALDASLEVVGEMDFWGGGVFLLIFGMLETILFSRYIDSKKGWIELHRGAHIIVPDIYRIILKYVSPILLVVIFVSWIISEGWDQIMMTHYNTDSQGKIILTRCILLGFIVTVNLLIAKAWKTHDHDKKLEIKLGDSLHD